MGGRTEMGAVVGGRTEEGGSGRRGGRLRERGCAEGARYDVRLGSTRRPERPLALLPPPPLPPPLPEVAPDAPAVQVGMNAPAASAAAVDGPSACKCSSRRLVPPSAASTPTQAPAPKVAPSVARSPAPSVAPSVAAAVAAAAAAAVAASVAARLMHAATSAARRGHILEWPPIAFARTLSYPHPYLHLHTCSGPVGLVRVKAPGLLSGGAADA